MRRSDWAIAAWVEGFDRVVAEGDVVHVDRLRNTGQRQDARHVGGQARVVSNLAEVGLEQPVIGRVKSD